METSPSDAGTRRFEVVGGGQPSPEEVAAIAAALAVVLDEPAPEPPPVSRWRWAGRARAGWPGRGATWRGVTRT